MESEGQLVARVQSSVTPGQLHPKEKREFGE